MYDEYADDLNRIDVFPWGKTFRLSYDKVVNSLRIVAKNRDCLEELRQAFSVENKAAFFSKQYGYHSDPRLYNINQFGFFPSGLVYEILGWIRTQYGTLDCVAISKNCNAYMNDVLKPLKTRFADEKNAFKISNVSEDTGRNAEIRNRMAAGESGLHEFEMRDYQRNAVEALFMKGFGRGLIEIPTAGGKSYILANYIWNIIKNVDRNLKFMILVPNVQLVEQFFKDLLDYGYDRRDLAKFEGGMSKKDKKENDVNTAKIIIANRQYVFKNEKALPPVDVLICDEVHSMLAKSSQELVLKNKARFKVGCSGTIPTDKYQRNQLVGMFGKIVYKENITDLQGEGFISKLKITTLSVCDKQVEANRDLLFHIDSTKKYVADDPDGCDIKFDDAVKAEHEYFAKWYKDLYTPVLEYVSRLDGNTLVLFDKIDIGTGIYEHYVESFPGRKVFYNDGSTKVDIREEVRTGFERSDGNVLFANVQIMSTGLNLKRLHNVVFAFGSKSATRVIQSIGRVLRLYSDKDYAHLVDTVFNMKYSSRHYRERLRLYKEYYDKRKPDEIIQYTV